MKIQTKKIDLELEFPISSEEIEKEIEKRGIKPLRWAIVNVSGNKLTISVAGENL